MRKVAAMTHRTVAPNSDTYEIRLYWYSGGRKYLLGTIKDGSPKRTRRLFQTVERSSEIHLEGDLYVAELYNLEQEYAHEAHMTDIETLERLSGKEIDELMQLATEVH